MAEKEYIERGALQKIVYERLEDLEDLYGVYDAYAQGYEECADRISEAPAADVVEVRHGHWIKRTTYPLGYNCSECNNSETYKSQFCRLCGAKMDGGKK